MANCTGPEVHLPLAGVVGIVDLSVVGDLGVDLGHRTDNRSKGRKRESLPST